MVYMRCVNACADLGADLCLCLTQDIRDLSMSDSMVTVVSWTMQTV